jgi:hypothetical protein
MGVIYLVPTIEIEIMVTQYELKRFENWEVL